MQYLVNIEPGDVAGTVEASVAVAVDLGVVVEGVQQVQSLGTFEITEEHLKDCDPELLLIDLIKDRVAEAILGDYITHGDKKP